MRRGTLKKLLDARAARRALVLVTRLDGGGEEIVCANGVEKGHPHASEISGCLRTGRSRIIETGEGELFLQAFLPAPRLIIIGATHIAQVLARLAREVAIEPFVIDPRTAFATRERFGDVKLIAKWPGEALDELGLDARCAVVCLAHVPDIDDEALGAALRGNCFYLGALGSIRSHEKRVERLKARGFSAEDARVIHAPVGLDIGSVTPNEIALSIIAEVVGALRAGSGDQASGAS